MSFERGDVITEGPLSRSNPVNEHSVLYSPDRVRTSGRPLHLQRDLSTFNDASTSGELRACGPSTTEGNERGLEVSQRRRLAVLTLPVTIARSNLLLNE